jgi:hypothetical protein
MSGQDCGHDKLRYRWNAKLRDFWISYPRSADGHLIAGHFGGKRMAADYGGPGPSRIVFDPSFTAELEARGYDLTTLKFEVRMKKCIHVDPPVAPAPPTTETSRG